jgi:dihydrofolate synthase/folylpolyglutamate synthase
VLNDFDYIKEKRNYRIRENLSRKSFSGEVGPGGDYQAKNLQAVYQAFNVIKSSVPHTDKNLIDGIRKVVANTKLAGRWQIIGRKPLIVCDTGHNKEGLEYVMNQVNKIPKGRLHLVLGFVSDKDLGLIMPLFPSDGFYYFTKASVPRALDEKILMAEAANWNLKGESYPDVKSAVISARTNASENDMIFIGGSTFIVADAL